VINFSRLRSELTFGNENGFLCVFVGRIALEKRLDFLVDVISKLDGVYLAIIGECES
jgi:glycogen synthase